MVSQGSPLVPGYETLGVLGQGGFGVVYRARQLAVGREVALKVDNRVLLSDRDRRRFMREVTSAGALSGHPHVADVYDAGVLADGRPYMVLELCPGGSLADRLKRQGPLAAGAVRDIGVKIADALAAAHAAGVLHRDVKPANILLNSYGMVALSDFGLATMPSQGGDAHVSVTRESLTPAYAPPEAFDLSEPTAAGDVYSLAATLYALLSGRPPRFPASGVANIAVIIALHRQPVPGIPGVPEELVQVLRGAMAFDPAERTATAAALREELAALSLDGTDGASSGMTGQGFAGGGMPSGIAGGGAWPGIAGGGMPSGIADGGAWPGIAGGGMPSGIADGGAWPGIAGGGMPSGIARGGVAGRGAFGRVGDAAIHAQPSHPGGGGSFGMPGRDSDLGRTVPPRGAWRGGTIPPGPTRSSGPGRGLPRNYGAPTPYGPKTGSWVGYAIVAAIFALSLMGSVVYLMLI